MPRTRSTESLTYKLLSGLRLKKEQVGCSPGSVWNVVHRSADQPTCVLPANTVDVERSKPCSRTCSLSSHTQISGLTQSRPAKGPLVATRKPDPNRARLSPLGRRRVRTRGHPRIPAAVAFTGIAHGSDRCGDTFQGNGLGEANTHVLGGCTSISMVTTKPAMSPDWSASARTGWTLARAKAARSLFWRMSKETSSAYSVSPERRSST